MSSRSQAKRGVLDELRAISAARALCFSISNRALGFKRQQVRPIKERHDAALAAYLTRHTARSPVTIMLDMNDLTQLKFPEDVLERVVFEKTNVGTRPLALTVAVCGAASDLGNTISYRNSLVAEFRERRESMTEIQRIQFYLGMRGSDESDQRWANNIASLIALTDDCLYFSMALTDELTNHGNRLRARNRFKFRLGVPKFLPADWTTARQNNLFPDQANYEDWVKNFKPYPTIWSRVLEWTKFYFSVPAFPRNDRPKP